MAQRSHKTIGKFKFSFVLPLYKVEDYLDETVESILGQSVSFEENCEIIFINDGSPDNVEQICLEYKNKYPGNIKYFKQKNSGVSVARNKGMELAEGEIVSFLDSDDLLSTDALEKVLDFFDNYGDDVDVVSIKMQFFEATTVPHILNYKYHSTRIVDIEKEYDNVQLSASSAFVRLNAIKGKYTFDSRLQVAEDAVLITQVILDKMRYGVIAEPTYFYRRRATGGSAMNTTIQNKSWYTNTLRHAHQFIVDYTTQKLGHLPRYVQFLLMYDMQWRLKQNTQEVLNTKELATYKQLLGDLLLHIDDEIILEQRHTNATQKLFILEKKCGTHSNALTKKVYTQYRPPVWVEFVRSEEKKLILEGHINFSLKSGYDLYFCVGNTSKKVSRVTRTQRQAFFLGEEIYDGGGYVIELDVPKDAEYTITAFLADKAGNKMHATIRTMRFTKLADKTHAYRRLGSSILIKRPDLIRAIHYSKVQHLKRELVWQIRILASLKLHESFELIRSLKQGVTPSGRLLTKKDLIKPLIMPLMSAVRNIGTVFYRNCYYIAKIGQKQSIWILSDRTIAGGDNGEALFRYLSTQKGVKATVYFAISKTSPDYQRLRKFGKVLDRGGFKYKILFLLSDKIISSHADDFVINPYRYRLKDIQDLYNFDYVFLQHGITKDDISGWLNRYNKNIALFISAARPEYQSLLKPEYGYSKKQVALTGFPRYDLLKNNQKNKIILAPTWRKVLADEANQKTGTRVYDPTFKESSYYRFYQSILDDKSLHRALDKYDMTVEFYLHPSHAKQVSDFKGHERVIIKSMPYDYKVAFAEGNILITDYSSVAFDFAYLKKPVIYTQYDKDDFFGGHLYNEGYFSYQKDGFGPVVANLKETIDAIQRALEANCVMSSKYIRRVEKFFYKFDRHNSKRVTDRIQSL